MSTKPTSCQYIPTDTHKEGLSLIHGEKLSLIFEGKEDMVAVRDASFTIEENSITAIIGASGSGKSTLLKLIYGLLEPNQGEVRYRGWRVPTRKDKLIPGHDAMKMVSQGFDDLNLYAKVWDNIASQLPNTDLEYKQSKTQEMLERLQIDHLAQKRVADLSGGERQRVAISRALVNDPEVLLMDEPFNQVDAAFRDALQQDIRQVVADTGLTVVLVSHDPSEVLALADKLIVMKDGNIIDAGDPKELYYKPKHPYTAQLLAKSNILTAEQAKLIGITTSYAIGIHQEKLRLTPNLSSSFWVKDIRFRGLYNEYVVGNDHISLHVVDPTNESVGIRDRVDMDVLNYIVFNAAE